MKVFYDLTQSVYYYQFKNITFYFSSNVYREKFKKKIEGFIVSEITKLYAQYNTVLLIHDLDIFFAIALYKRIEKRGLRILDDKGRDYNAYVNAFYGGVEEMQWNI